ncbi:EAL domain-containing protein [Quatrionicoccus australiensis]|uniref:EAL domain-containing protein n=1 Tax=Quatrionicoccus australiensis TaxID=138118 RepID=UPI001CF919A9|nr:EAL domain-containing protein [Quatrionicoccus australiensis]UCV15629.1 EAL domain-containing protein [Quatrionicoccus australiensis]
MDLQQKPLFAHPGAEGNLEEPALFARTIANHLPGLVAYWTKDLRCAFANEQYFAWFGRTSEQMLGLPMQELLGKNLFQDNHAHIQAALRGEDQQFERQLIKTDGQVRHTWTQYIAHKVAGEVAGFVVLVTDITSIKQTQAELRISNIALQAISQGVIITGPNQEIITANAAFLSITGYALHEVLGKNCRLLQGALSDPQTVGAIREALRKESNFSGELLNYRKSGEPFWNELNISPIHDGAGQLTHFIGITRDITERKRMAATQAAALSRLENIADRAPGVVYEYRLRPDGSACFPFASDAIRQVYRVSPEEVRDDASAVFAILHPEDLADVEASILQSARTLEPWRKEYRVRFNDGTVRWLFGNALPHREADGSTLWHGFITDISGQKQAEEELRIAAIAFASQSGMVITDAAGVILRVNPAFTRLTGYTAEEAIGQTPALLNSGRQDKLFYQRMWQSLQEKGYWQGEIWNKRKNGQIYAELLTITAVITPDRGITHFVGNFSDITEDKEAEAEIHRLAYYDSLTRLPNRRLLLDRLGQAIIAAARSDQYGVIFFIDLDNFKALNDTRGHDVGDLLLVEVARRLSAAVRASDTVARQGGDEFVVLMENMGSNPEEAARLANTLGEKLRLAIDQPFILKGYEHHCRVSIGVSMFHQQDTVENLFKQADLALYQAKNAGRNTLRFFDPAMQAALDRRSALEADLRLALKNGELLLHYQPQLDAGRRVIGAEALVRWQHPTRGLIAPGDFIPLAEDTGLILPLGQWVLETACAQLKIWENAPSTRKLQLAVNVSARQFRQSDFVALVRNTLLASAANPARLKLELTESLVLEDVRDSIEKMHAIKRLGVKFSLDDFGTGHSSLSYLGQLPLDQLKIDQSFVRNLPGRKNDETIARTIITMGLGLDMDVIAEGVENEEQLAFLDFHGCHAFQGYLFSRPLPAEQFAEYLDKT